MSLLLHVKCQYHEGGEMRESCAQRFGTFNALIFKVALRMSIRNVSNVGRRKCGNVILVTRGCGTG